MRGYLTTFAHLFDERSEEIPPLAAIEIPMIQRDYAQGRTSSVVGEVRRDFLEVLLEALTGGEPVGLDFVYGRVADGTFHPLDGQQRLTTLFLLHWYVASAAEKLATEPGWLNFSYATRPSARLFCDRLGSAPLPKGTPTPSAWIVDQPWYQYTWRHDPTVQAMLVMIDSIHEAVSSYGPDDFVPTEAWERLVDRENPAIAFYLLPLEDLRSDEDLYVKMNSRGKPLTPFETFKARLEREILHLDRAGEFARLIDRDWSDTLWPFRGDDDIVDDEFMRYFDFLFEIRELSLGLPTVGSMHARARALFGPTQPRAEENLAYVMAAFSTWSQVDTSGFFDELFSVRDSSDPDYNPALVTLFGQANENLLAQCLRGFDSSLARRRQFGLSQSLLLHAVLVHRINGTMDVSRRLRVLRNLIAASENEIRRDTMGQLLDETTDLILTGSLSDKSAFNRAQIEDERRKAEFLAAYPPLTDVVARFEDTAVLRGGLGSIELEPDLLEKRWSTFNQLFSAQATWHALTGALLATGDYFRARPNSDIWQFGSRNDVATWRYLLTATTYDGLEATRTTLMKLLDEISPAENLLAALEGVTGTWLDSRVQRCEYDWRYYLVRYPSMRSGDTGIYFSQDPRPGYRMCMLRRTQRNSRYRDPVLLAMVDVSEAWPSVEDPWFTGYESEPRWLTLKRSGAAIRNVDSGLQLRLPDGGSWRSRLEALLHAFDQVTEDSEGVLHLGNRQAHHDAGRADREDRIELGADLLSKLVAAGF